MINKLLEVRGKKPGKSVSLSEDDLRYLCTKSREIFISQPNLLELEAPIKICGKEFCYLNRRRSWLVLWFTQNFRVRWFPSWSELLVPGWLYRQGETVNWDDRVAALLQDQISWKLFPSAGQSRVCSNQQNLRVLRRVQTPLLNQTLESFFRCFQLSTCQCADWWENPVHARWSKPRFEVARVHKKHHATNRCARPRTALRPALVRPRTRSRRVWRKRSWRFVHVWWKRGAQICGKAWHRFNLQSSPSSRGRLRIFWEALACNAVQCAQLLWRVRQFGRNDVDRRHAHVQFLNFEANGQAEELRSVVCCQLEWQTNHTSKW